MALSFIPSIWAARLMKALEKALVYGQAGVVNRDYEGEIREAGNAVKIASIGSITVGDYVKNTDIDDPQILTDAQQTLSIDQAKYFNFFVDQIDRAQQNVSALDDAMGRSAYALRDAADSFLAAVMVTGVDSGNLLGSDGSPIVPTATTAYEKLVDLGTLLDEDNVPSEGRFCVVPPWYHGLLLKDDRFVKAGTSATDTVLRNGQVGEAAGFMILKSNNVLNATGTKYKIVAGHSMATSYAEQVLDLETYKPEKRFGDAVKGLHVYGAKVVRGTALAMMTANKS